MRHCEREARDAKIATARQLRADGLSYPAIGRKLRVSHPTVWRWLNPERARQIQRADNARPERKAAKRAWDAQRTVPCADCGCPRRHLWKHAQDRCDWCYRLDRTFGRAMRLLAIARGWQAGLGRAEIARRAGTTPGVVTLNVSRLRAGGLDLAYRLPHAAQPAHLEPLRAGRDAWHAERREVAA